MIINHLPIDVKERREVFEYFWDSPWSEDHAAIVRYALLHDPDIDICRWCPQIFCAWGDRSVATRNTFLTYLQQLFFDTAVMNELLTAVAELGFADDEIVDAIASHIGSTEYCVPLSVIDALDSLNHSTPKALDALEWATTISAGYYADEMIRRSAAETLIKLKN
jgi:hypothetical protein